MRAVWFGLGRCQNSESRKQRAAGNRARSGSSGPRSGERNHRTAFLPLRGSESSSPCGTPRANRRLDGRGRCSARLPRTNGCEREGGLTSQSGDPGKGRTESETATSPTIFLLPQGSFRCVLSLFSLRVPVFFLLTPQVRRPPPSAISSAVLKSLVPSLHTSPSHERASLSRPSLAPPFFYCPAVSVLSTPFPVPRQESYRDPISQIPDESPPESSGRLQGGERAALRRQSTAGQSARYLTICRLGKGKRVSGS